LQTASFDQAASSKLLSLSIIIRSLPALCATIRSFLDFNGVVLDETRRRFASTDQEILKLNQQEIAARLDNQHIPPGNRIGPATGHTELGLITHLVGNPDMNLSIREVIKRSAGA
jgi:hypothetical protein